MVYLLNPYYILLGCEDRRHQCYGLKIVFCCGCCKDTVAASECNILEAEMCEVIIGAGGLSWAKEEEVCDYDHIAFGLENGVS